MSMLLLNWHLTIPELNQTQTKGRSESEDKSDVFQ